MLSLVDCIAFSGLTPTQLDAIACHRHIPAIVAAEWAETMLERAEGCAEVEAALAEEVALARDHHLSCAEEWARGLDEFHRAHASG